MATPAWQAREPATLSDDMVMVSGSTFAVTDANGDILGSTQGLFDEDRRVLDRLVVSIGGVATERVGAGTDAPHCRWIVSRGRPLAGHSDSSLLVDRRLELRSHGLTVRVTVQNLLPEHLDLGVRVQAGADFASVFAVKEGIDPVPSGLRGIAAAGDRLTFEGDDLRVVARCPGGVARADGWDVAVALPPRALRTVAVDIAVEGAGWRPCPDPLPRGRRARLTTPSRSLMRVIRSATRDLDGLRLAVDGEETVAAGAPWFMALFGRDSLLASLMALPWRPALATGTLTALARRQGRRVVPATEEEPGRILHETRLAEGTPLLLGGGHVYYGSCDASLLFVVLLGEAVRWGMATSRARALLPAADAALGWARRYGDVDGDGFVESVARTPAGLVNQGWKDSWNGVPDADGRPATPPIALVEVQGYWYAALRAREYLARTVEGVPGDSWRSAAADLRGRIDAAFWSDELSLHVLGLDADKRQLVSATSNAGHLLWTGAAMPERVGAMAATLLSRQMRSSWGVRTLAADHPAYNPLGYHVGSVWPHDTALLVWGLSRWGLTAPSASVAHSLIRAADLLGRLPELFGGFSADDPLAHERPVPFPTSCSPQAWAAGAPLLLLRAVLGAEPDVPAGTLRVNAAVPPEWAPLTLRDLSIGPWRMAVRATSSEVQVLGSGPRVLAGPVFGL